MTGFGKEFLYLFKLYQNLQQGAGLSGSAFLFDFQLNIISLFQVVPESSV